MTRCDEFQAGLSAYLDGEAGDQEEAIRAHVEGCHACRRVLEGFRHISGRIRAIAEEEPATLVENIRCRVRKGDTRRRGRIPIPRLAAAAMLLAALLWTIVLLGDGGQTVRLSGLVRGGSLSETEQRMLYGEPPADDEWMVIVLSGGSPR